MTATLQSPFDRDSPTPRPLLSDGLLPPGQVAYNSLGLLYNSGDETNEKYDDESSYDSIFSKLNYENAIGQLQTTTPPSSIETSLGSVFKSLSSSFGDSGHVSAYDDDFDPITLRHTVAHEKLFTSTVSALESLAQTVSLTRQTTSYWESDLTYIIIVIVFPILLAVGTIGNVLTYIVLHRKTFTDKSAASWLFRCLAVMCTVCLWVGLPRHWLRALYGVDIRQLHVALCHLHKFTLYCAMDITTWIIVSISADRLIAVLLPFRAHHLSTRKNAKRVFVALGIFFAIFNAHIFFTYGRRYASRSATTTVHPMLMLYNLPPTTTINVLSSNKTFPEIQIIGVTAGPTQPSGNNESDASLEDQEIIIVSECQERDIEAIIVYNQIIHPWMSFAIYVIGPFCFMLASSITIARKLAQRRAFLKKVSNAGAKNVILTMTNHANSVAVAAVEERNSLGETDKKGRNNSCTTVLNHRTVSESTQRSTTMLMFAASIEFLLTATPAFFLDLAEKPLKQSGAFSTPHGMARFQLIYTTVRLLMFSNFALHFFLFCLSTASFRREVFKVLCCQKRMSTPKRAKQSRQDKQRMTASLSSTSISRFGSVALRIFRKGNGKSGSVDMYNSPPDHTGSNVGCRSGSDSEGPCFNSISPLSSKKNRPNEEGTISGGDDRTIANTTIASAMRSSIDERSGLLVIPPVAGEKGGSNSSGYYNSTSASIVSSCGAGHIFQHKDEAVLESRDENCEACLVGYENDDGYGDCTMEETLLISYQNPNIEMSNHDFEQIRDDPSIYVATGRRDSSKICLKLTDSAPLSPQTPLLADMQSPDLVIIFGNEGAISDDNTEQVASTAYSYTDSELNDDELRAELFQNFNFKGQQPLLVTVINDAPTSSTPVCQKQQQIVSMNSMERKPSVKIIPPIATMESDFFRNLSRNSTLSPTRSRKSQKIDSPRFNGDNNNGIKFGNIKRNPSIIYVYLTDPILV